MHITSGMQNYNVTQFTVKYTRYSSVTDGNPTTSQPPQLFRRFTHSHVGLYTTETEQKIT